MNDAITEHLKKRIGQFKDNKRNLEDKEGLQKKDDLDAQINSIKRAVETAQVDIRDIQDKLDNDNNDRQYRDLQD